MNETEEFSRRAGAVIARLAEQNGRAAPPTDELAALGTRLWVAVAAHGWPRALREGETGAPGGMSEEACAPLVARVMAGRNDAWLAGAVRQLVKACLYPEFTECRDSYREVAADGGCRRQELGRVRGRASGAHCVDCPHWTALGAEAHAALLKGAWAGDAAEFAAHRGVFLPEDFRELRQWLHARARGAEIRV